MKSRYFYINVSQTLAVIGAIALAWEYLDILAESEGVHTKNVRERVKAAMKSL